MSTPHAGDKSAAFTGLILGAIAIFVLMFAIVRFTNAKYAGHGTGEGAPAAPAAAPTAGPAPTPAPAAAAPH